MNNKKISNMTEPCCDIVGRKIKSGKKFLTNMTASSAVWIPAFVQRVDAEKCTGCGSCVRVCMGNCYEIKELMIKGKRKRVSVAAHPENCFGDCHCHKTCPAAGGAMICAPKEIG